MARMTPTVRTLKFLREQGLSCAIAEHWNAFAKIRQDLFGFIDIVAIGDAGILGVQCTSSSNHVARVKKILSLDTARNWLKAGGRILVISWDGKKERVEEITKI